MKGTTPSGAQLQELPWGQTCSDGWDGDVSYSSTDTQYSDLYRQYNGRREEFSGKIFNLSTWFQTVQTHEIRPPTTVL